MEELENFEPSFGDIVDLVKKYEDAVQSNDKPFFEEESFEFIIQFYHDNREYKKTLQVIESAIIQYPFSSFFLIKKAEIFAEQSKFEEALAFLDYAEVLDPADPGIFLIRADIFLWQAKHEESLSTIKQGLEVASEGEDIADLYLEQADVYEDLENYNKVLNSLKLAIENDSENDEALNRFWFCTELTEKYQESVDFHLQLVDKTPYNFLAWFNLGHAYAGLEKYEEALDSFGFVIAINEDFDSAYICSGDVLFLEDKFEQALDFYLDAIKLSKPNKELYLKTAECFEMMSDLNKSRNYLRKAIAVDPSYDEAFYKIGETYRTEENWQKAITSFERAVKLNKENIEYLSALADAYLSFGEGWKAVNIYKEILDMDPKIKIHWLNLASAYFNVEEFKLAFQVLTEAEQKYDNDANIYYIKFVFYYQVGNKNEALLNLEKGLMLNYAEHYIIFELDEKVKTDPAVMTVLSQYAR